MFKDIFRMLKQHLKYEEQGQNTSEFNETLQTDTFTHNDIQENSKELSEESFSQFASDLSTLLIGCNFSYPTPNKYIKEYIEKNGKDTFFEALKYVFALSNQEPVRSIHCSLIRNSREQLCEILVELEVTPIDTWLNILLHNYNNELYPEDLSIEFLCDIIPENALIRFIASNFNTIIKRTETYNYYYFSKYDEWKDLFTANIIEILENANFSSAQDCLDIIKYFPDCAIDVYEFILNRYYSLAEENKLIGSIWSRISIIDDVLQPLADYHKHFQIGSKLITESFITHFISSVNGDFSDIFNAKKIFEEDFRIDPKFLETLVKLNIKQYINYLCVLKFPIKVLSKPLFELFSDNYSYNLFMDNIDKILHCQGIELYAFLVKHFKDNKEILEAEHCCFEYD